MDWEAIGAIGEVLGAIGVIFSLVYLASQIRASTRQTNADAIYNLQKAQADVMESFHSQPESAKIFAKLECGEPLKPHEQIQVDFIVARVTGVFAAAQASADNAVVSEKYLEDANVSLNIFATRFRLTAALWKYTQRAHASVADGLVFKALKTTYESHTD